MSIMDRTETKARRLIRALRKAGLTAATAESCTGGNIAHAVTAIAGASDVYNGSVVAYQNSVKHNVLGVDSADLEAYGAVSEPVVRQMAEGVCRAIGADCSMATSGIAGPGGAVPGKPVGTVWMAVCTPRGTVTRCAHFGGSRAYVIAAATDAVMDMLAAELEKL